MNFRPSCKCSLALPGPIYPEILNICETFSGFLEGRDLRYSVIPGLVGSAMVRVVMLPSPIPSTTDLNHRVINMCFVSPPYVIQLTSHLLLFPSP